MVRADAVLKGLRPGDGRFQRPYFAALFASGVRLMAPNDTLLFRLMPTDWVEDGILQEEEARLGGKVTCDDDQETENDDNVVGAHVAEVDGNSGEQEIVEENTINESSTATEVAEWLESNGFGSLTTHMAQLTGSHGAVDWVTWRS